MHDDSDDDDHIPVNSAAETISPTLKLEQDPGSNEFVNVIAPNEEEMAAKGPEIEARTLSVEEEIPKHVEKKLAEPIPSAATEKAPPILDDDAGGSPIFTNEMPLQFEPESMTETEPTNEPQRVRGVDDEPQMPGSFDMSTASPNKQLSWMEMIKNLGL